MKTSLKNQYYLQLFILIIGVLSAIVGCFLGFGSMLFYFIVGIPQLISFLTRIFKKDKKSIIYIIYGIFILPVWIILLMIFCFRSEFINANFLGIILTISLICSPIMAVFYVYDAYKISKQIL